jgi:hypothetical protein
MAQKLGRWNKVQLWIKIPQIIPTAILRKRRIDV